MLSTAQLSAPAIDASVVTIESKIVPMDLPTARDILDAAKPEEQANVSVVEISADEPVAQQAPSAGKARASAFVAGTQHKGLESWSF